LAIFPYEQIPEGGKSIKMFKRVLITLIIIALLAGSLFISGCQSGEDGVVIGSKEFTESLILSQISILALEANGIPTVDETGLGGTVVAREALEAGEIDHYWEYTGTALVNYFGFDVLTDPEECYQLVRDTDLERNNLVWLDYTQYNNTYVIMMRQADADALGIYSISDLAAAINEEVEAPEPGTWKFGTNHEYSTRDDGFPGLLEHYDFEFDSVEVMDYGILYTALRDGELASAMGFGTDGRITPFELVILEDDQFFHPVYNSSPVFRQEVIDEYPQIPEILGPIATALDNENMANLNRLVDEEDHLPREVAEEWLIEQGFIE
jgi:osmoprotectant transport system substrate-binding protein